MRCSGVAEKQGATALGRRLDGDVMRRLVVELCTVAAAPPLTQSHHLLGERAGAPDSRQAGSSAETMS